MEKKIRKEYKQAIDEVEEKLDDYIRRFKIKDEKWRQWVEEGKKTKQEYQAWRTGQIAMGNRWRAVRERLAKVYANADMAARSTVLGFLPEVYALNHNWGTYEIEHELGLDTSYSLYNAEAVERLIRDDPQMLPPPGQATQKRIREGKAELWNNKQIQSVMIQSILQGEAITKIATRLAITVGDRDRAAAIRNARTMTIGAMNAGRVDSYLRAESMGIKLKQQWVAALDMRTRVSHRHLDGVAVAVGARFPNGCRFPGDPDGAPSEIYNCRCSLRATVEGFEPDASDLSLRPNHRLENMSYAEWKRSKKVKTEPILRPDYRAKAAKWSYLKEYMTL